MSTDSEVFDLLGKLGAIDDEANCRAVREALNAARAAEREACASAPVKPPKVTTQAYDDGWEVSKLLGELGAIDDEANYRAVREALKAARAAGYDAGRVTGRGDCLRILRRLLDGREGARDEARALLLEIANS